MKPTSSEEIVERRRWREVDAKVCAKGNIGTINSLLQKIPVTQGSSSPFAGHVRDKLREILKMIDERSIEMGDEVREEARANEARRQRQAELDQKIGELERQLQALQLERADLGKEDELFTQLMLSSTPPLPPVPQLTTNTLEPQGGKGAQIASTDIALFVDDVERVKTPESRVAEKPRTPDVRRDDRRPAPGPRPHNGRRSYSIGKN